MPVVWMTQTKKRQEDIDKYEFKYPEFAECLETLIIKGFTIFAFPRYFWKRLRTSNLIENLNLQIQRRIIVCGLFPNPHSALRLISAVLNEIHEDWQTDKRYLETCLRHRNSLCHALSGSNHNLLGVAIVDL